MLPEELKALPQWVCAGPNKIPIDPKTGEVANVMDPSTWASYDVAVAAGFPHVGFVLTKNDPYCFIDLDEPVTAEQRDRHTYILSHMPSYAEYSQSGRGIHIICRATVPHGVRRDKVEVYSDSRYMICTGNAFKDAQGNAQPIRDLQHQVLQLFTDMDRQNELAVTTLVEVDQTLTDTEVVLRAERAINADKFKKLCRGDWQGDYPSQSEADFALLSMLCFYTKSNDQVRRIFRISKLGQRPKAQNDKYLNTAIAKIRASEPPPIEFTGKLAPPEPVEAAPPEALEYPPGFVGALAQYITETSLRPVAEVGIAAALALSAGIVGRQYNINGTGLNLYVILLAKTGVGKEGGTSGIERVMAYVRQRNATADIFLGPGAFASGQSLIRRLDEQECFVAVMGEFGHMLQNLSDTTSNAERSSTFRRVLLDLYTKSGAGQMLRPNVYSDKEKNTKLIASPAVTLLGESTPDEFYAGITLGNVAEGLIPRFLIIEHFGDRPPRNPDPLRPPSQELIAHLDSVCSITLQMRNNGNSVCHVQPDREAYDMLMGFDHQCDQRIRAGGNDGIRQLWNRAHLKALRVAGILAAMNNPHAPVVTGEMASWAIAVVQRDVRLLVDRFSEGDVGEGDSKQVADLRRVINEYLAKPLDQIKGYGVNHTMHARGVIPYSWLFRRLSGMSSFRKDRRGAKIALHSALEVLVHSGMLYEVNAEQIRELAGRLQKAYFVPNGNGNGTHT